jgi:hypothetical protein
MGVQNFLVKKAMEWKMRDVPEAQREQILTLVQKDPELFKKIGEEVDRRVKGGEGQTKASMTVMKKYQKELQALMK